MEIRREEKDLTFPRIEETPVLRPAIQLNQSSLCSLPVQQGPRGKRPNDQGVSIKRTADGRRQRSRKITDENRAK